jgi:Asp-tRNA(Asn)/Glu-tRNA(Gln) amidotransferase A subunit family amidase
MARTPGDLRLFLEVLASTRSVPVPGLRGLRVGVSPDLLPVEEVRRAVDETVATLIALGCTAVDVSFPGAEQIRGVFAAIQQAEALGTHRDAGLWPERRAEYGGDVGGRLAAAEAGTLTDYVEGTVAREQIRARFDRLFEPAT